MDASRSSFPLGRVVLVALAGAILALVINEELRNRALDLLFGAEEEFDYVPTSVAPQSATTA